MDERHERIVVDFDHLSPEFAADPAASFRSLRERCPVSWSPHHGGFWIVARHEDVARVAREDATFSSARHAKDAPVNAITIPQVPSAVSNPIELDPPEFFAYRKLLNPLLSPAAVVGHLVPQVQQIATWCVDQVIERGECDLIHDVASPVPSIFTIAWLGLPLEHWRRFAEVQHGVVSFAPNTPEFDAAVEGLRWSYGVYAERIAKRRSDPRDDVISYLLAQEVDGKPLSDQTVLEMISLLVAGGVDTTTSLTSQALLWLHDHPEDGQRLIDDDELLMLATEEFLRYFCPVTTLARTATTEVEVGGEVMHPGDRVMLPWFSANRDPEVFDAPDELHLDRFPNRHTSFGLGIHRCVGSNLARESFRAILREVLVRMPDYRIDASRARPYPAQGINTGWSDLPTTFTSGARSGEPAPFPELDLA